MNKIITLAASLCLFAGVAKAQTQRTILYEEFTGENCGPCAGTNPYVDAQINPNMPAKILLVRYQVNIPSAPGPGSLYQDNTGEVGTRKTYYSVPFAPYARFNGIQLPDPSGQGNDGHAILIDPTNGYPGIINDSAIVNAPFGITVTHSLNATADSIFVNATVTAAMSYTAASATSLKLQVSLQEAAIHFYAPTGTNGEKDFYHVMRKMLPNASGTQLQQTWANAGTQSFTIKAKIPTYIHDKSQLEIVTWVEDQRTSATTRRVHNAAYSAPILLANDASASAIASVPLAQCINTINPVATIKNTGNNTLTSCTVNYKVDAGTPQNVPYTGTLAPGATATLTIPTITAAAGTHTLYVYTSSPNSNTDINPANDQTKTVFSIASAPMNAPVAEPFTSTTFPPANWFAVDPDHDNIGWTRMTATGSSSGTGAARVDFYNSPPGNMDELYLPYTNLGSGSQLTFYVAGAPYTASTPENDKLEFMVSSDCGQNWTTLYSKSGSTLYTSAATTSAFAPSGSAAWRMETVNLSTFDNQSNLLMKFMGTSDYGNDVWVDDVNLTSVMGIQQHNQNVLSSSVYPNPAGAVADLRVTLSQAENVKVTMYNSLGQPVSVENKNLVAGDNFIALNTAVLANGLYTVVVSSDNGSLTHKLTVSK